MAQYKILIVDDEPGIAAMLKDYFEFHGYLALTAGNGAEALKALASGADLILLDINLPDVDGLEICRRIRGLVSCPIIFLTARIKDTDAVIGFQSGGDDYVVKPFNINELGARVEAHLRRENRSGRSTAAKFYGSLAVDYSGRQVTYSDKTVPLTKTEFDIVALLSQNPGQVFDKEQIYEHIWGFDREGDSAIITEHIRRIRNKFLEYAKKPYIATVWGVGYKWQD